MTGKKARKKESKQERQKEREKVIGDDWTNPTGATPAFSENPPLLLNKILMSQDWQAVLCDRGDSDL